MTPEGIEEQKRKVLINMIMLAHPDYDPIFLTESSLRQLFNIAKYSCRLFPSSMVYTDF